MTQIFKEGRCIPVTLLQVGPCTVLQVKTVAKEGYNALQLGYDERRKKTATKPEVGHAESFKPKEEREKSKTIIGKFVREVVWDGKDEIKAGQIINLSILEKLRFLDVTGVSKGKGFQGGVKRYHFEGGARTHGESDRERAGGSIGATSYPARVIPNMRMPGHMGNMRSTVHNLKVEDIDANENIIAVRGSVPGPNGGYIIVKKSPKNNKKSIES